MTKRKISIVLICVILLSVVAVRGQFLEKRSISSGNDKVSVSLSEQEIAEEVNKKFRSAFVENQGQVGNEEIIFYGSLLNGKIAFGESKVMLWMEGMNSLITLNFVGARKVSPIGLDELVTKSNYFLGNRGTCTNVRSFCGIIYYDLWKGIDLSYKATPKGAKYEFRVASGANPEDIRISCEGHDRLNIGGDSLTILKGKGRFVDEGLKVFQEGLEIDARFVTKEENTFGFQVSKYDQNKPLVIDPLLYSTFIGGNHVDYGRSIALDSLGNAYVTGYTHSSDFPTTANAFNRTQGGGDCFVFKLAANGSSLLYSTFVGGSSNDYGKSIAIDSEGNACVTGYTASSDFPTTENAYNRTHGGYYDCFVFKLSADGSSLLYSTFIGGSGEDSGVSIILDSLANVYVTGETVSSDFPTTANAYNRTHGGSFDCFVFKLSANGSILLYSTFVGRSGWDSGWSIVLNNGGNAYVTGKTHSSDFPTTLNAYDKSYNGGGEYNGDCFVFKLSTDGSTLLYSTYIGGKDGERGISIALDDEENAYVTGQTFSSDFPTTANAYNGTHGGSYDCFVFKLAADGSSLLFSTYVGGSNHDIGFSITLDNERKIYVTGITSSNDFPTTTNAYSRNHGGKDDCFIFKLSADGSSLLYSTFVGGSSWDYGLSIALDSEGKAYVTGDTASSDFPTTTNAYDESFNDGHDCFVFKILIEDAPTPTDTIGSKYWIIFPLGFVSVITIVVYRKKRR